MRRAVWVPLSCGIGLLVCFVLWGYAHSESYCYIWPSIDTTFAPDYDESAFHLITKGMTKAEVTRLVGLPLQTGVTGDGLERWWYSRDGRCPLGDFAWLGRYVELESGHVKTVVARVYYD